MFMNLTSKEKIILLVFVCLCVVQSKSQTKNSVPPISVPPIDESPVSQIFISSDGCFSIHPPDRPSKAEAEAYDSPKGRVSGYKYSWYTSDGIYNISYSEFPYELDDVRISNKFLNNLRDKLVSKVHGQLQTDAPLSIDDYPGREIIIRKSDGALIERMYLVDRRLFQLSNFVTKAANEKMKSEKGR
jgi:hypothetical protein